MKKSYIDLKEYYFIVEYLNMINTLILLLFLFSCFFFIKKSIVLIIKLNYLRVHYYYLSRSNFYLNSIKFFEKLENKFFARLKNKKNFIFAYIFVNFFFKFMIVIIIIKNMAIDNYVIYTGWLPCYALYYFLINVNFFFKSMNVDFERGSFQCYFENHYFTTKLGFYKLYHYHKYLITCKSRYRFKPCELYNFELRHIIPNTWVFYYYRTFNIIDVYEIAKYNKPKLVSKNTNYYI